MVSGRGYFVVAIIVFLVFAALGHFFGPNLVSFINQTMNGARSLIGDIVLLIGEPLKFVFNNPLIGAAIIGFFWPVGAVLVGLFLVMMLIALGGGTVLDLGNSVQGLTR
jgi:hypothetical protein